MYSGLGWTPFAIFLRASLLTIPRVFIILKLSGAATKPLLKSTEMSKASANFVLTNPAIEVVTEQPQRWQTPGVAYLGWRCCSPPYTGSTSDWPSSRLWWRLWRAPHRLRRFWGRHWDCRCWGTGRTGWSRGTFSTHRTELKLREK